MTHFDGAACVRPFFGSTNEYTADSKVCAFTKACQSIYTHPVRIMTMTLLIDEPCT